MQCDCPCDCGNQVKGPYRSLMDRLCYECRRDLHVRDVEGEILRDKSREVQPEK